MEIPAKLLARKINKRNRYNKILDAMREPITCRQLEVKLNYTHNSLTNIVTNLYKEGYLILLGKLSNGTSKSLPNLWQAVKFDYFEEGVDYDKYIREEYEKNNAPLAGLGDAVYVHNPNHAHFVKKYREQGQQAKSEYKSPKNYAGVYGVII